MSGISRSQAENRKSLISFILQVSFGLQQ